MSQQQKTAKAARPARKRTAAAQSSQTEPRKRTRQSVAASTAAAKKAPPARPAKSVVKRAPQAQPSQEADRQRLLSYLHLPHIPRPHVALPSQRDIMVGAVRAADTVRDNVPPAEQLVYYAGLGALAAFGVVDWPIAVAVGAGVWLVGRRRRGEAERKESRPVG